MDVRERMRADWNARAGEDAYYYVAFGRRDQDDEEFFATAADVVRVLERELKRLDTRHAALEIGCGPGRLIRPLSRHFTEIHGVDISDEMIRLAGRRLADTPNAFPRHNSGDDLSFYASETFDLVYSYAVFQHIPSAEVIWNYLREGKRVLKPGGILRCQMNGLPPQSSPYDTWSGARITPDEVRQFARHEGLHLLALEDIWTQYMWVTFRKPRTAPKAPAGPCSIRYIFHARTGERAAPASGPLAAIALWIEALPEECDLNGLTVTAGGLNCRPTHIGPREYDGVSQVNVSLPEGLRTGLVDVELGWRGSPLCAPRWVPIIQPGPPVPRINAISDAVNLLSGVRILSGLVKVLMSDIEDPALFLATVDGKPARGTGWFCTDATAQCYEFNFGLPHGLTPGPHEVRIAVGRRGFAPVAIEVA